MREAARSLFRFHAFRRTLSVAVLILIDSAALALGVLVLAYLAGTGQEVVAYLPIMLAVGLALFAAHDLYNRAARRRNPGALVGAVMWWAGLLIIGSGGFSGGGVGGGGGFFPALLGA